MTDYYLVQSLNIISKSLQSRNKHQPLWKTMHKHDHLTNWFVYTDKQPVDNIIIIVDFLHLNWILNFLIQIQRQILDLLWLLPLEIEV